MHYQQQRHANLHLRANLLRSIRDFFHQQGFLEVETPMLIPANAPEEYIEPISTKTHFLQTSPELCMKRLLCRRGYGNIFQISHCWRYGERGTMHLPEFTMLEWYRINSNYEDLMIDCLELLAHLDTLRLPQSNVSFNNPVKTITIQNAYKLYAGINVHTTLGDGTFDEVMVNKIEPALPKDSTVILKDYPVEKAALARLKKDDQSVAERFELYLGGIEIANGFSELNDPVEQRRRFNAANNTRVSTGTQALPLPGNFLNDLTTMPPSAGIALGIDRLVMLAAGADKIDEVVAFTPEEL